MDHTHSNRRMLTATESRKPNLDALTSIRFLAAMHVVAYHYLIYIPEFRALAPEWIKHLVASGPLELVMFFVLSGFVLTYNYVTARGALRISRTEFWQARLVRLYPMYLLGMLVYA